MSERSVEVHFSPLYGAFSEEPLCYLLSIGGMKILLDIGWTSSFDPALLKPLEQVAPTLDAVIISHPDLEHLGALPYAVGKLGLTCKVFITTAAHHMGQLFLFDALTAQARFSTFTEEDITKAFSVEGEGRMRSLRYREEGSVGRLTLKPYPSGRLIGGAIWRITYGTEEVVYAVDFNHRNERHLNKAVLATEFKRPALLITDAYNYFTGSENTSTKEGRIMSSIMGTLRSGGNVLMPVDSAGRVLELLFLLEDAWSKNPGNAAYEIAFLSNVGETTIRFVKTLNEWLSDRVSKAFLERRERFALHHIHVCTSLEQVRKLRTPQVVLATMPSLNYGFARDLLIQWAPDARNLILFTGRPEAGTIGSQLLETPRVRKIEIEVVREVDLVGAELEEWRDKRDKEAETARMEKAQEEEEAQLRELTGLVDDAESSSDEEENEEDEARAAAIVSVEEDEELVEGGGGGDGGGGDSSGEGRGDADGDGETKDATPLPRPAKRSAPAEHGPRVRRRVATRFVARYPMFMFEDERGSWTHYGRDYDEMHIRTTGLDRTALATSLTDRLESVVTGGVGGGGGGGGANAASLASVPGVEVVKPTKEERSTHIVTIQCAVQRVDMEGRADGESIRNLLQGVSAARIIVVHGAPEATLKLRNACMAFCESVECPRPGQVVDASSNASSFDAVISSDLALDFRAVGPYEIAHLDAVLVPGAKSGTLVAPPMDMELEHSPVMLRSSVFRLPDLVRILHAERIQAQHRGGVLVTSAGVKVSRSEGTEAGLGLKLEGPLCEEYYAVRDCIYSLYTLI